MARVFLDTNVIFDIGYRKPDTYSFLNNHTNFISPLSVHILSYSYKIKVPDDKLTALSGHFVSVDFTKKLLDKSLKGPTNDLEDNIQLQSAAFANCEYLLTKDKKLLKMKFFGKTKIISDSSKLK